MQAAMDTSDSNVSSSTTTRTQLMEEDSTVAEALPEAEVQCPSGLSSTDKDNCGTLSAEADEEREACVSSQHMDSSNSDKNEDDSSGECDNASEISEFSDFSQESWQPVQGPIAWVQEQMRRGKSPRKILEDLVPSGTMIPDGLDTIMLWKIIISIVSEPPKRKKLNDINTLDDVLRLLNISKKIIVLTGAGVSVSCGIPDFRSQDGVYARLAKDFPNLPDPQAMFDIHFFQSDPRPFFKFAREIYPGQFKPSPCHRFIRMLEEKGKLLRNYTQNIDTLEQVAGIEKVIQCHGSFATATCTVCGHKVDCDAVRDDIFNQVIPHCPRCSPSDQSAVMKPDIVFFGESLPEHFHNQMAEDKDECDLLIVIGSSLKVRPVALIPNSLPANIPQILINRERLHYLNFDVELLGNCDDIIGELCRRLGAGWEELATAGPPINEILLSNLPTPPASHHSDDSRDVLEDADNPTISSSEATIICSGNKQESPSVSEHPDQALQIDYKSEHQMSSAKNTCENDDGVQIVSISQSEPSCTKVHRGHYHPQHNLPLRRHFLKRPHMSPNTATDTSADQVASNLPGSDQASDVFCSSKEVETLVSACHKKDVMYIPSEKSSHNFHSQQSCERTKSQSHHHHHGQTSVHEQSRSPKHSCQPSTDLQITPPNYNILEHNSNLSTSESFKEVSIDHEIPTPQEKPGPQVQVLEESDQILSSFTTNSVEADLIRDKDCPRSKKPRLDIKGCQEDESNETDAEGRDIRDGPDAGVSSASDSQSREGSLGDLHKMWRSRCRVSLAQRLADNQVLFMPPSCYVFKGAEVFSGSESEDSDDSDDEDGSDDVKRSSDDDDDDGDSVDIDTDKVSGDILVSSEKSDAREEDSTRESSTKRSHQHKLKSSSFCEDGIEKTIPDLPVKKMLAAKAGDTSVFSENICGQPNECAPSTDIPHSQNKMGDGLAACSVSSTEDLTLQHSAQINTGLHSMQNQRD